MSFTFTLRSDMPSTSMRRGLKRIIGRTYLRVGGWREEGTRPAPLAFVLIAAPHTSNWDLPLTIALSFVYDVLSPFARRELERALTGYGLLHLRWRDPQVEDAVRLMAGGAGAKSPEAAALSALALMQADQKDTGLKILQGLIWQQGYESGELRGHVYPDVPAAFSRAALAGVALAIYSSGSVAAQRLLFQHSALGDLSRFITAYFDTTTGPKQEAASYRAIARALGCDPSQILFGTDHLAEAEAARLAGVTTWVATRPGNAPLPPDHGFRTFASLLELPLA